MAHSGPDNGTAPQAAATAVLPRGRRGTGVLRDLSLARKLLVILMATSLGALLLSGVAITTREIASSRHAIESDLGALAGVVAGNSQAALSFGDPDAARNALASLAAREDIARAALLRSDRTVLGEYVAAGEHAKHALPALGDGTHALGERLAIVRPVTLRGERLGTLVLVSTLAPLRARVRDIVASVLVLMLVAALFAYVLSLRLVRVVTEPIHRLSEAAHRISERNDYAVRVEWPSRDELGVLTASFNAMMDRIQAQEAELIASHEMLRQAQKMEAVGQLAGGVAHDFNNLLTAINGYAMLLERRTPPEDPRRRSITEIRKAGDRAAGLVRQLLAFGRKQTLEPRVIHLRDTLADIGDMLGQLLPKNSQLVWATDAPVCAVKADPGQIQQAVVNLVVNARDAMPAGGTIAIEVGEEVLDEDYVHQHAGAHPGPHVVLVVRDTGTGIPLEIQRHVFEPFFTTKGVGKGTGLGLATVYGIVQQSQGHVTFETAPGAGTTFRIHLPAAADESPAPAEPVAAPASGGHETILVVDDEPAVCALTRDILALHGYAVLACVTPAEAIATCAAHEGTIDLLLTDFMMPGMNGLELARKLVALRPGLRTMFVSGYTDGALAESEGVALGAAFLQKPFDSNELALRVRTVLDAPALARVP